MSFVSRLEWEASDGLLSTAIASLTGQDLTNAAVAQNPAINFNGITSVSLGNLGQPKWVGSGGYWTLELTLIEFAPSKPAKTGPADPAKNGKDAPDPQEEELKKVLDEARKA